MLFDGLPVKEKTVSNRDFSCVHAWMNECRRICYPKHAKIDVVMSKVKELNLTKATQTDAEVLTDYLRVGLGHMLLASLSDGFVFDSDYTLMKMAFRLYLDRGLDRVPLNRMLLSGSIRNTL